MRVLLAGGGSGGSATPLLAVAHVLRSRDPSTALLLIGTETGPEAALAAADGIPFVSVPAGKLRRYWSLENFTDPARVAMGVVRSLASVRQFRPDVAFGAGGFASVPPLYAARALGVPVHIHQQDVVPGLANRLLAPIAARISLTFAGSLDHFPPSRSAVRGNPVRPSVLLGSAERAREKLGIAGDLPLVVITGGGTGALGLNRLVSAALHLLDEHCEIAHLTGRGRAVPIQGTPRNYHSWELLTDGMQDLLAAADVVVTRAGMGTLTELAALRKAAIVIPMPDSHQEYNARAAGEAGAGLVLDERAVTPESFASTILALLGDADRRSELGAALSALLPPGSAERIADDLSELASRRVGLPRQSLVRD
ncbi:MAG: glycosyltransferase [Chloroflexota bacterium]